MTKDDLASKTASLPRPIRLALLPDYREENWPSMDLCADMLMDRLKQDWQGFIKADFVVPPFRLRLQALPWFGGHSWAYNGDRFLNRHWDFPRHLHTRTADYDFFHVCDHSYAQLALGLPAERTGVFCHDLDTFRCLLESEREPRPLWFRWMMRRVLRGFERAAVVFYTTLPVRDAILRYRLVAPEKLVNAPLGCAREFTAQPVIDPTAERILSELEGRPYLLHVGSCVPRKRVDFLLKVVAAVRAQIPEIRLIKVGGEWTANHRELIRSLELAASLIHVQGIERTTLAALYRQAALVLLPSEAEGFGLPLVEALSCGSPVLASDLEVLREVGGGATLFAPVADLVSWRDRALLCLRSPDTMPSPKDRVLQAQKFTWEKHVRIIAETYQGLVR